MGVNLARHGPNCVVHTRRERSGHNERDGNGNYVCELLYQLRGSDPTRPLSAPLYSDTPWTCQLHVGGRGGGASHVKEIM